MFERFNQIDAALTATQTKFLSQRALPFLRTAIKCATIPQRKISDTMGS